MTITLSDFISRITSNPALLITVLLTLGVIMVNGWTDAPNAIATCISTRAMRPRAAIAMAALFNFFGVLVMTLLNATVAQTIYNMVDFGSNAGDATIALCAGMFAIVLWATIAWWFGIPTSESHALIAGISGAAVAIQNGFAGINGSAWLKVIYGLLLSSVLGFAMGFGTSKLIQLLFKKVSDDTRIASLQRDRLPAARPWRSCMARKTGRSSLVYSCLARFLRAAKRT